LKPRTEDGERDTPVPDP